MANGVGERIAKDVNGDTTHYYVVNDSVLYTYKEETVNSNRQKVITSENVIALDGSVISSKRDDGYYVYNVDIKGSVVSIIAPDGQYELVYGYDVYGEPVRRGNDSFYNEITFTGAIYDVTTGLVHLSSRYYDPTTGRFISMDSYRGELDDPQTLNLYAYCWNNPAAFVDRDGHFPFVTTVIGAFVGGVVNGGFELVDQLISGEKVNWKKVGISAGIGFIDGAIIGTGSPVFSALKGAVSDGFETALHQRIDGRSNWGEVFISAGTGFFFGGVSKANPKAEKARKKVDKIEANTKRKIKNRISKEKKNKKTPRKKKITKTTKYITKSVGYAAKQARKPAASYAYWATKDSGRAKVASKAVDKVVDYGRKFVKAITKKKPKPKPKKSKNKRRLSSDARKIQSGALKRLKFW